VSTPDDPAIRRFLGQDVRFELSAADMGGLPAADRVEIAFAGRSNVGKSSLINALLNRNGLARASAEPGRTRQLNFFLVGDRLRVTDLPGYGYARAPKTEIAQWTALTRDYLRGRPSLARVFLLVDARHGAKEGDRAVMAALDAAAVVYQGVLTKADKVKPTALEATCAALAAELKKRPAAHPEVLAVSAVTGDGLDTLRLSVMDLVGE
jgi:GTP-binding protein